MISFLPMEGNGALIKLLDHAFAPRAAGAPPPRHVDAVAALTFVPAKRNRDPHPKVVVTIGWPSRWLRRAESPSSLLADPVFRATEVVA
jgi:hypothetical protein